MKINISINIKKKYALWEVIWANDSLILLFDIEELPVHLQLKTHETTQ